MVQVVNDLFRMRMLMAGVYLGLAISSTYGFSIFADHLKTKYKFSQRDITTISTVGNCVGYCSFLAGMLFDYAGPMVVLPLAGSLAFLGFFLFGLAFDGVILANPTPIHFSIFNAILYLGCPAMDVSCIMPLMLQFPLDRGYVVMIQKTFSGLGVAVLMGYFNGWFKAKNSDNPEDNNYSAYAYFIGCQALLCSLVGLYFTRMPMYFPCAWRKKRLSAEELTKREGTLKLYMTQYAPPLRLRIGLAIVIVMLIFSTTHSLVTAYVRTSHAGYMVISILTVLIMASFAVMALPFQFLGRYTPTRPTYMEGIGETATEQLDENNPEGASEEAAAGGNEVQTKTVTPAPQYSGSFWSHLLTIDLWALWLTCFGMWGTWTVILMNAAQVYRSKNYGEFDTRTLTLYVTIMSVGSAVGRICMGYFDMKLSEWQRAGKTKILTTAALPLAPSLLTVAFLLFAVVPHQALLLPFFLGAVGNGVGWALGVLTARILYAEDIGKHYNFCFSSGFVSTIALNRFMFGEMYDNEARKRGEYPACNAPSCVRNQMFILLAFNVLATVAATVLHLRFARFTRERLQMQPSPSSTLKLERDVEEGSGENAEPFE